MSTQQTTASTKNNMTLEVLGTAIYIVIFTVGLIYCFISAYKAIEKTGGPQMAYWNPTDSIQINPGPSWFLYDETCDSIKVLKPISEDDKLKLLALGQDLETDKKSFYKAVNIVSFNSNNRLEKIYLLTLWLSAISAALGVQLRTINNFIGVTCKKNEFDFKVWWPWYFVRPVLGCLVGPVIFIMFDGNIISFSSPILYSKVLAIAICILAGFGVDDVLFTLRTLSKRVFGYNKEEK